MRNGRENQWEMRWTYSPRSWCQPAFQMCYIPWNRGTITNACLFSPVTNWVRGGVGWGDFNIHATTADPHTRSELTVNLRADSLFWKLFFTPLWVWFTAKGPPQPVTRQPAERTQTEKSIIDQRSNPLMCEKRVWQRKLPGRIFGCWKVHFQSDSTF